MGVKRDSTQLLAAKGYLRVSGLALFGQRSRTFDALMSFHARPFLSYLIPSLCSLLYGLSRAYLHQGKGRHALYGAYGCM